MKRAAKYVLVIKPYNNYPTYNDKNNIKKSFAIKKIARHYSGTMRISQKQSNHHQRKKTTLIIFDISKDYFVSLSYSYVSLILLIIYLRGTELICFRCTVFVYYRFLT